MGLRELAEILDSVNPKLAACRLNWQLQYLACSIYILSVSTPDNKKSFWLTTCDLPSEELTYPILGTGNSASKVPLKMGYVGYVSSLEGISLHQSGPATARRSRSMGRSKSCNSSGWHPQTQKCGFVPGEVSWDLKCLKPTTKSTTHHLWYQNTMHIASAEAKASVSIDSGELPSVGKLI